MENFLVSVNIVLPLFIIMAAGYLCRRLALFGESGVKTMNNLIFRVFLPCLLFRNAYNTGALSEINWWILAFAAASAILLFALLFALIPLIVKDNPSRGALIQGIGRSNYALFGIPLAALMFEGRADAVAALLVAVVVPLFNMLSVITLEVFRGGRVKAGKILTGILKNPLIVATLLGLAFRLSGLKLPQILLTPLADLSKIASPFSLFVLGGSFEFSKITVNARLLALGVLGKLIISPLIFTAAAVALGFRGAELGSLMIVFMSPTAVSSFPMAQQMGANGELAGQQVVLTTVFSVFSIFLFIYFAKLLALI